MPAPAFGSVGTKLTGTASTANVAVPSGVAAGDIIIVVVFVDGTTTVSGLPSGFAQATGSPQSATNQAQRFYLMWKRATGADSGTYNFTLSASAFREAFAARYTGAVASGDPWDDTDAAVANLTTTTTPPVSVTTTGADRRLVFAASNWAGGGWTPPTVFTERQDTGGERIITLDDLVQAAAGSSGNVSATATSSPFSAAAWLGSLLPATGEVALAEGTIDASVDYDVTLAGVRGSAGQLDTTVGYDLALSGARESAGTLGPGIAYDVHLGGARPSAGTLAPGIGWDINLVGSAPSVSGAEGDLQFGVDYQMQLAGARDALGQLGLGLAFDIDLVGARPSTGNLQLELGYEPALVGPAAPGGSAHFGPRTTADAGDGPRAAPTATWSHRQAPTAKGR